MGTYTADAVNIAKRKTEHIEITLERDVEFKSVSTGFEDYYFIHQALPELDLDEIDQSAVLFGKKLKAPIFISSMVGGIPEASRINRNLAEAAQQLGLAMGVGSQRCAIENESAAASFQVRDIAPDILLCANLGAVQLNYGWGLDECRRAVDMIGADALILHLNPLQEALQPEGNTRFAGIIRKIEKVCRGLEVPVIVKEVGFGISEQAAGMLASAGAGAVDVAGAGGTSWSETEKHRAGSELNYRIAETFESWGIPTSESVRFCRRGAPLLPVIASGGIRTGIDAAKAIALGANAVGIALPLLKAAYTSPEAAAGALRVIIDTLKIAMFCAGARDTASLRRIKLKSKNSRG